MKSLNRTLLIHIGIMMASSRLGLLLLTQETLLLLKSGVLKKLSQITIVLYQITHYLLVASKYCLQNWRLAKSLRVGSFHQK